MSLADPSDAAAFDGAPFDTSAFNQAPFGSAMPGISPGVYDRRDFQAVAEMVRAEAGIMLPPGKAMLVYSRLAPLVRASGLGTFAAYLAAIRTNDEARRKAVCALTTNHTFFYREEHHFHHFAEVMRPRLRAQLDHGAPVRLWSAGCSSGEEVWSLVMTLLGPDRHEGRAIATRDLKVLASDIADHALERARAARYEAKSLGALPAPLRSAWTTEAGSDIIIAPEARQIVQFRRLNLQGQWPMRRPFQAIFCRNVMIYFDQPTKDRLVSRFAEHLEPGGYLYIGHSERVSGPAMEMFDTAGPTIYRRRPQ